ncbi:hypothetical protein ACFPRL_26755 [Pseudoclavibacter helvolus]
MSKPSRAGEVDARGEHGGPKRARRLEASTARPPGPERASVICAGSALVVRAGDGDSSSRCGSRSSSSDDLPRRDVGAGQQGRGLAWRRADRTAGLRAQRGYPKHHNPVVG